MTVNKRFKPFRILSGFSLVEVLIVVMLISAGILPIYSLIKSGQKRLTRADTRTLATLFGSSAIELARTLGYEKAQKLNMDRDFKELQENAKKNGYDLIPSAQKQEIRVSPGAKPTALLRVEVLVKSRNRTLLSDAPELRFITILTDTRYNFY